jgi:hypothetical protein
MVMCSIPSPSLASPLLHRIIMSFVFTCSHCSRMFPLKWQTTFHTPTHTPAAGKCSAHSDCQNLKVRTLSTIFSNGDKTSLCNFEIRSGIWLYQVEVFWVVTPCGVVLHGVTTQWRWR